MDNKENKSAPLSPGALLRVLDALYKKTLEGIPPFSSPAEELAKEYLDREEDASKAAKAMLRNQVLKCTASGVITGIGGVLTLPVSIPANVSSTLYMQLRMIACTAYMAGFDLTNETVQAYIYAALAGIAVKSSGRELADIRNLAAKRLLERAGEKGMLNLAKLIPGIGAGVNGGIDFFSARAVSERAYRMFFEKKYAAEDEKSLFTRGGDLYRTVTGNDLSEDVRAFAERQKQRVSDIFGTFTSRFSGRKEEESIVYVSMTGKNYHTDPSHAGRDPREMTLSQAIEAGYTPCRRCVPHDKDEGEKL